MTNTTLNVPRELLERAVQIPSKASVEENHAAIVDRGRAQAEIRAILSAPSPAGVDGPDYGNGPEFECWSERSGSEAAKLLLPALRQYMHNDGSGLLAGYDLETTQAIIDGLRGEVADLRSMLATVSKVGLRVHTERDQHAKRIGELEGLLRAESARVDFLDAYIVTADAPDTGKAAMLADSGTLRECIDAAMSAGKEG